jgi:hypothetical protein
VGRRREYARLEKQGPSSRLSWLCEWEWPELVSMYCNKNIQTVPQSYFVVTSENRVLGWTSSIPDSFFSPVHRVHRVHR